MEKHKIETQKEKKKAAFVEFICDSESVLLLSAVFTFVFSTRCNVFNVSLYTSPICQLISHQYLATFQSSRNPKSGDSHIMRDMTQNCDMCSPSVAVTPLNLKEQPQSWRKVQSPRSAQEINPLQDTQ